MKKILITGGGGDIARAISNQLSINEYDVYSPTRNELDVTNIDNIDRVMALFQPSVLINNAGFVAPKSIKECDVENTKKQIEINLLGTFYCTEVALRYNKDLLVINIASAAAIEAHDTWSEYCAAKAAVVMATKCWAQDGIYSVAISPARTKTKMRKQLYPDENQSTLLDPNDFARVVVKAVEKEYKSGSHIVVRKQTVEDILRGKIDELF